MKRIKIAVIILAIVLVAAGVIFGLSYYFKDRAEKNAKAEEDKLIMFEFDAESSNKVEITNESGTFIAEHNQADGWKLTNTDEIKLNSLSVTSILSFMSDLKAVKILDDTDTSKYGFDNPVKVTVHVGEEAYTILVGDTTPTYENFYAMKENDDTIYLIEYSAGAALSLSKDALKQTYLYDYSIHDVDHFAVWTGGYDDEHILFSMDKDSDYQWSMSKPSKGAEIDFTQVNEFLTDSSNDQIYTFVQENCTEADYSKYGFDNPQHVFEISALGDTTTLIFGAETGESERFGLFVESGQVVTLNMNELSLFNYKTLDIMETSVFSAEITNVAEVDLMVDGSESKMYMLEGENSYSFDDVNVTEKSEAAKQAFLKLYHTFNNAYIDSAPKEATPTGESEMMIKYTMVDGIVTEIKYIPAADSDEYYAMINGNYTGYTVKSSVIENIIKEYANLVNITK